MPNVVLTEFQIPDKSILDAFNKQTYLGNSYIVTLAPTAVPTGSPQPLLYLVNPSSSSKSMFINVRKYGANVSAFFNLYSNPTVTMPGTPITPVNLRPASTNTAMALAYIA